MILFTEFVHHRDEQIGSKNDYRSSDIATCQLHLEMQSSRASIQLPRVMFTERT